MVTRLARWLAYVSLVHAGGAASEGADTTLTVLRVALETVELKDRFRFKGDVIPYWNLHDVDSWGGFFVHNTSRSTRPRPLHPPPCPFCGIATGKEKAESVSYLRFSDHNYIVTENINQIVDNQLVVFPRPEKDQEGFLNHRIDINATDVELMISMARSGFSGLLLARDGPHSPPAESSDREDLLPLESQPWVAYVNAFPGSGRSVQHLHINLLPAGFVPILSAISAPWQVCQDRKTGAVISRFAGTSFYGLVIDGDPQAIAVTHERFHAEMNKWERPYNLLVYPRLEESGPARARVAVIPRDQEYCEAAGQRIGGLEFITGVLIPGENQWRAMDSIQRDLALWQSTLKDEARLELERRLRKSFGMPPIGVAVYQELQPQTAGDDTPKYKPVVQTNTEFDKAKHLVEYWTLPSDLKAQGFDQMLRQPNVLVRVTRISICQSDRRVLKSEKPGTLDQSPLVLGHEGGGYVVDPGPWNAEFSAGAKVVILPHLSCDGCKFCFSFMQNLCPEMLHLGFHLNGSMAELMSFPYQCILPVGASFPDDALPLVEPLACVLRALFRIKETIFRWSSGAIRSSPSTHPFTIYGSGPMGCLAARAVKRFWPNMTVRMIEPIDERRLMVDQSKIADTIVRESIRGEENYISFVASSRLQASLDAIATTRHGGTVVLFSGINTDELDKKNLTSTEQARDLEVIHRGEGDVTETYPPLYKRLRFVGSSGYNFDDARRSEHELRRHYDHYATVQNVEINRLNATAADYLGTREKRRFTDITAVEALLSPDGVYAGDFSRDIAKTIKVLIRT